MPEVRQSSFALLGDLTKVNKHVYNLFIARDLKALTLVVIP